MAWIGLALHQGLVGIVAVQTGVAAADVLVLAIIWAGAGWTRVRIETGPAAAADGRAPPRGSGAAGRPLFKEVAARAERTLPDLVGN
jgi:hypothetical protein